jgi:hypothetical protein
LNSPTHSLACCIADCIAIDSWLMDWRAPHNFGCRTSRAGANLGSGTAQLCCWWQLVVGVVVVGLCAL